MSLPVMNTILVIVGIAAMLIILFTTGCATAVQPNEMQTISNEVLKKGEGIQIQFLPVPVDRSGK